jgi:hypothetical protein
MLQLLRLLQVLRCNNALRKLLPKADMPPILLQGTITTFSASPGLATS